MEYFVCVRFFECFLFYFEKSQFNRDIKMNVKNIVNTS